MRGVTRTTMEDNKMKRRSEPAVKKMSPREWVLLNAICLEGTQVTLGWRQREWDKVTKQPEVDAQGMTRTILLCG